MRSLVLGLACALTSGCGGAAPFVCEQSSDCSDARVTGVCEANGYCSFPDPACASGQRYGDHAASDVAGTCVDEGATSGATGGGCADQGDCYDENPCTDDRCEADVCMNEPRVDDPACACTGPGDCRLLPADDDCRTRTCEAGVCVLELAPQGTAVNATLQTAEDCQRLVCDGNGGSESVIDLADVPDDGLECTLDACDDGEPTHSPLPDGSACAAGACNDRGQCIGCDVAADCGAATFCQAFMCNRGICGVVPTPADTVLPDAEQTDGDCQRSVCDGNGNAAPAADDDDVPADDGSSCTDEACSDGRAAHPAVPAGSGCAESNGAYCDGAGACVECTSDQHCPAGGQCTAPSCDENTCVVGAAPMGTDCDDALFCTATDACDGAGTCVGTGSPCAGADGDADCSESCNENGDACTANDPNGAGCSDGLFCTGADACNGGNCVGGANPCPGPDGDSDCSETCSEDANACSGNDPSNTDCGDCRICSFGNCMNLCSGNQFCCAGDDFCIPQGAQCP